MLKIIFLTVASGTHHKVIRLIKWPYVMVNYMTKMNKRPPSARILFVDSSGYPSSLIHHGYPTSDEDYLKYVKKVQADMFVLRDYPCEPEILKKFNTTPKEQIHKTIENHIRLLELLEKFTVLSKPIPVIQGWFIDDYLYAIDLMKAQGLIFDYMAIGSLCRRHAEREIANIITTVRKELPSWVRLHAFGVKISVLRNKAVYDALFSIDSCAFDYCKPKDVDTVLKLVNEFVQKIYSIRRMHERQATLLPFSTQ